MNSQIRTREQAAVIAIRFANYRLANKLFTKKATVAKLCIPAHRINRLMNYDGAKYFNHLFTDETATMLAKSMNTTVDYVYGFNPTDGEKQEAGEMIASYDEREEKENKARTDAIENEKKAMVESKIQFLFNSLGYYYRNDANTQFFGLHVLTSQRLEDKRQIAVNDDELRYILSYLSKQLDFAVINLIELKEKTM